MKKVIEKKINKPMTKAIDREVIIYDKFVLVNAFFYTFWMSKDEYNKYVLHC